MNGFELTYRINKFPERKYFENIEKYIQMLSSSSDHLPFLTCFQHFYISRRKEFSLVGSLSRIYENPTMLSEIKSNIQHLRSYPYHQNGLLLLENIVWMLIIAFTVFCPAVFVNAPQTPLLICSSLKERTILYAFLCPTWCFCKQ